MPKSSRRPTSTASRWCSPACVTSGISSTVILSGAHGLGGEGARRQRREQLPSGSLSPQAFRAGPLNITVQEEEFRAVILAPWPHSRSARKPGVRHPTVASAPSADRLQYSPGRVGSLRATVFFVARRLPTLPGKRHSNRSPCRDPLL